MGAVCTERHCGFKSRMNRLEFCFKKSPDRGTIGPRSGVDRGPGSRSVAVGSGWSDSATKDVRSRLDHAMIAARSDRDRGVLPRLVCIVRC